jgi:serine/threonine protein kinase
LSECIRIEGTGNANWFDGFRFVENGSLGQTLKAFGHFNEKLVSSYVAKILEGLEYLHSQGVGYIP